MSSPRVALIHISPAVTATFVRRDLEILRNRFEVKSLRYRGRSDLTRLASIVATSDVSISWFAWDHAYWAVRIARILNKPSILVTGGFDVVGLPEIGYGSLLDVRSARRVRETAKGATRILAISESIRGSVAGLSNRSDIQLVPLGFDPDQLRPSGNKESLVVTVGYVNRANLVRKGIGTFVELAQSMPTTNFAVIGGIEPELAKWVKTESLSNLIFTGHVSDADLVRWLQRAKVYVQLSAHEGFGSAVAEAMLTGCVPVVSDRGALPEVTGNEGGLVPWGDIEAARLAVSAALQAPPEASRRSRERIRTLFPLTRRRDSLLAAVTEVLGGTQAH